MTPKEIGRAAYGAGFRGSSLVTAIAVALGESSGRPEVVNSIGCVGLWQINQPVHVRAHPTWTRAWLQNASNNAAAAFVLSSGGRNWGPWSVYTSGAYKRFLPQGNEGAAYAAGGAAPTGSAGGKPRPKPKPIEERAVVFGGKKGAGKGGAAKKAPAPPPPPQRVMENIDPRAHLGRVFIHGGRLGEDLAERITDASLTWAIGEVPELKLKFEDPGFEMWRRGIFTLGAAMLYREDGTVPLNLQFRVAAYDLDGGSAGTGGFTLSARSQGAWRLKKRRGAKVMKKVSPSEFVAAECKAVGLKAVVQKSSQRPQVARDVAGKGKGEAGADRPSSWTTFNRLASELGYVMFEFADTIYFGKPSWLLARDKDPLQVALPLEGAPDVWVSRSMPTIRRSEDAKSPVSIGNVELERSRLIEARPGGALQLRGLPPFNALYLIDSLTMPLLGTGPLEVAASTPENPKPQPPPPPPSKKRKAKGFDDDGSPGSAKAPARPAPAPTGKTGAAFVAMAITASNARYVFGGEASSSDPTPSALDCSELVQWALGRIGVPFTDGSSAQYAACRKISVSQAFGTRGALLWKPGHIGISMGNGQSVEARNPSAGVGVFRAADISWAGGGLVPGLGY